MRGKIYSFDIWGICVSRDIFGITNDSGVGIPHPPRMKLESMDGGGEKNNNFKYVINNYLQGCSIAAQFSEHVGPELTMKDLNCLNVPNSFKKWYLHDYNKTALKLLTDSDSEWIIIDFRSETYDNCFIHYSNGMREPITKTKMVDFLESKEYASSVEHIPYDSIDRTGPLEKLTEFCKKEYGNNIILIEVSEAFCHLNESGDITFCADSEKKIALMCDLNAKFIEKTNCYYVKCPFNIISDGMHKWGHSRVHYVEEYYQYAFEAIHTIVSNKDGSTRSKLVILYSKACAIMANMRSGIISSVNNTIKRAELCLMNDNIEEAFSLIDRLLEQEEPRGAAWVGRQYRDGKGVQQDLDKAAEWMRKAADKNVGWAKNELSKILL